MNMREETNIQIKNMRENFKKLRIAKGLSIEELSKQSGIKQKILTDIEDGRDFNVKFLIDLCRFYRIQPKEIFYINVSF